VSNALTKFYKIEKKTCNHTQHIQSIIGNLRDRYWNMCQGNERGDELGARRAEQFPQLLNYTLTPAKNRIAALPVIFNYRPLHNKIRWE